jgi:hypothetical protein
LQSGLERRKPVHAEPSSVLIATGPSHQGRGSRENPEPTSLYCLLRSLQVASIEPAAKSTGIRRVAYQIQTDFTHFAETVEPPKRLR